MIGSVSYAAFFSGSASVAGLAGAADGDPGGPRAD
jgi:hypothetical protein